MSCVLFANSSVRVSFQELYFFNWAFVFIVISGQFYRESMLVRASQSLRDRAHVTALTAAPVQDERESFLLLRLCGWIKPVMII